MACERRSDCWYNKVCHADISCESCTRYVEMLHLMQTSEIPVNRQMPAELKADIDYDAFCELADIKDNIKSFVDNGENLYLCSVNTGNGKTSWSIKLMLKYFDTIWAGNGLQTRGLFVHVPSLLLRLKDFANPISTEYKQRLLTDDLIIWDDIAQSEASNYDYNNLLMLLDTRIFQRKANIFTSNITTSQELKQYLGTKLSSRIWNTSRIIEFKGRDRRNG